MFSVNSEIDCRAEGAFVMVLQAFNTMEMSI